MILDAVNPILYFQYYFLCHLPICSLVSLVVFLTSVSTYILFLPFSLLAFDVNGQNQLNLILSPYIMQTDYPKHCQFIPSI
jgi:hypothetical protein